MGGSSAPAQTTQVSKVELPAWVDQASQENYNLAKQIGDRPLQQYQGQTVADPSAMTTQGYGLLTSGVGAEDSLYKQAGDLYTKSAGPLDINSYLNPYTSEVENRAVANANTSLQQQILANSDSARAAGAFGGSRHGVTEGVTRAQGVKNIGDLTAQLRQAGFDTATQTALADRAGMRNTAAGIQGLAGAEQGSRFQNIAGLLSGGQQQQAQQQAVLDAAQKKFYEARDYPLEGLNTRLAALGMSPYGKTETSNKTATSEDKGPDWSTIGLGVLKTIPSLFAMSDRKTKTDIKKLGKDSDSGLDMYAYRYKGDPKSYPKVVGPMAQDIGKKYPKAVKKISGHLVVDINNLMEVLS